MKLTLSNVKELKRNSSSPLFKRVCNYVIDRWGDYNDKKYIFTDVLNHGCQSGVVTELIYYSDTVRFYKQYRQEINDLLYDAMSGTGLYAPSELFGENGTKKIRSHKKSAIKTFSRGSDLRKRFGTSATTSSNLNNTSEE